MAIRSVHDPSASELRPGWSASRFGALIVAVVALLAVGCSSDDSADSSDGVTTTETSGDASGGDEADALDEGASGDDGGSGGGGPSEDEVGNGVVEVDGEVFEGFVGDCEISRGFGTEDVGDLSDPGLSVIIGIDNVDSEPEQLINFVVLNEDAFRMSTQGSGSNVPGVLESVNEVGPRTASGSRDIVTVEFSGPRDDGAAVTAQIVCELQNEF